MGGSGALKAGGSDVVGPHAPADQRMLGLLSWQGVNSGRTHALRFNLEAEGLKRISLANIAKPNHRSLNGQTPLVKWGKKRIKDA